MPHFDDAARAPCLHTGTPAPAVTMAAIVLTLIEWLRSPPVPTMSIASARSCSLSGTSVALASTASSRPDSSSGVSPLARSATTKPISCAAVASPARIVAIAARACDAVRSLPIEQLAQERGPATVFVELTHRQRDDAPGRATCSGSSAALADDAPALAFGGASPDALLLTDRERVFEAGHPDVARRAHSLGVPGFGIVLREEDAWFEPPTSTQFPPHDLFGRHDVVPRSWSWIQRGDRTPQAAI